MVYVVLDYKVADYAKRKPVFDGYGATRKAAGSHGGKLFQYLDEKNHYVFFSNGIQKNMLRLSLHLKK